MPPEEDMSLNVSALRKTDTLTNNTERSTIPYAIEALDDDEWIKIRKIRNAIDDLEAWSKAATRSQPQNPGIGDGETIPDGQEDPDVAEIERRSAEVIDSQFTVREIDRYRHIWHYMLVDCFVHDGPSDEDIAAGRTRGRKLDHNNYQDMDDVFTLIGDDLVVLLQQKGGGVATRPVIAPNGEPAGFRPANEVGDTQPASPTADPTDGVLGTDRSGAAGDEVDVPGSQEHTA